MSRQVQISILVPCCNVEKYLVQCMDSILCQTFTDLEIICLNDGSTDSTSEILHGYAEKDSRVIVIDKPNSGYGATMNIGLEKATGKYIGIVESDDYIEKNMFETLYKAAEENDLDLVRCLYIERNAVTGVDKVIDYSKNGGLYECNKVFCPKEQQKIFFIQPAIWAGLYRKDFLDNNAIRFLETPGASYQDTSFAFKVYAKAERMMVLQEVLHNYRINSNSSVTSSGKVFFVCDENYEIIRYAKEHGVYETLKESMALRAFGSYKWNYNRLGSLKLKREFMKRWSSDLKECFKEKAITRRYFSRNRLFRVWLAANWPWLFYFIRKF